MLRRGLESPNTVSAELLQASVNGRAPGPRFQPMAAASKAAALQRETSNAAASKAAASKALQREAAASAAPPQRAWAGVRALAAKRVQRRWRHRAAAVAREQQEQELMEWNTQIELIRWRIRVLDTYAHSLLRSLLQL